MFKVLLRSEEVMWDIVNDGFKGLVCMNIALRCCKSLTSTSAEARRWIVMLDLKYIYRATKLFSTNPLEGRKR